MNSPRRVGPLIIAVGVVHVASTPVFFPESMRSIVDGGIVGAVGTEPGTAPVRAAGFWYAMAGVAMTTFGWMVHHVERRGDPLPAALPAVLAAVGTAGATLDPRSGFWAFFPLAGVARAAIRRGDDLTAVRAAAGRRSRVGMLLRARSGNVPMAAGGRVGRLDG